MQAATLHSYYEPRMIMAVLIDLIVVILALMIHVISKSWWRAVTWSVMLGGAADRSVGHETRGVGRVESTGKGVAPYPACLVALAWASARQDDERFGQRW